MKKKIIFDSRIKQIVLSLLILFSHPVLAQEILKPSDEKTYTEYIDKVLEDILINDTARIKNKILYDRVFPVARLDIFNDSINVSNFKHFIQAWNELNIARIDTAFMPVEKLTTIAYHFERQHSIPIGLINVDFSIIDTTALIPGGNQKLELDNKKIKKIPGKNPYITKHVLVMSPLNSEILKGADINFNFGKFVINLADKGIKRIVAHFENNQDFVLVDNGHRVQENFDVHFQNSGVKNVSFDVTYTDNTTQTTQAQFYVLIPTAQRSSNANVLDIIEITATKPFRGYDEPADCNGDCYGKGEYRIYYANGHTQITKPFIIVDGFDPGDSRKIDPDHAENPDDQNNVYKMLYYNNENDNLIWNLNNENYDVIILNFPVYKINTVDMEVYDYDDYYDYANGTHGDATTISVDIYRDGGADYIERNAKVLETLIDEINADMNHQNIPNHIMVAGPSMGALIAQYALREMELSNENHNVNLFISFDGPHKGANIPIGIQKALEYFNIRSALKPFNTPSAKQMLINHYLAHSEGLPQGAPHFRDRFQNELDQMGLPQQCTNVAILNGSIIGTEKSDVGGNFIFGDLTGPVGFLRLKMWINYTKNYGQQTVFRYLKKNWWGANTQVDIKKYSTTASLIGSLDNAPGGYFNIKQRIENYLGGHFPYYHFLSLFSNLNANLSHLNFKWYEAFAIHLVLNILAVTYYIDMNDDFSFVPTKSALAFSGSNSLLRECIGSRDLACTGETPFDSYYAPRENQEHASLHNEGIQWLLSAIQAMDNNSPLPDTSVYPDCTIHDNLVINGPGKLCLNETATYSNMYNCRGNIPVNWSVSNNLQILSSNHGEITVKAINYGNKWIKATMNGTTYTKHIVGKPSFNLQIENVTFPEIEIVSNWLDLSEQEITSIVWVQTGGDGVLEVDPNQYYAYAMGSGDNWYVTGRVEVTNSCGTTTRVFSVAPFMSFNPCGDGDPDNDYFIQKISANKYRVINPCQNYSVTISASELYDIYGVKTNDITPVQDQVDFNNEVNPGEIKIMKVRVDGKVLTKRILTD